MVKKTARWKWYCLLILVGLAATTLDGSSPAWATNRGMREYTVYGQGHLRLMVPEGWKAEFQRPITEQFPTIIFRATEGQEFKLLLTVQWEAKAGADFNSSARISTLLEKEWQEMAPSLMETRFEPNTIQGPVARGLYFLVTDKEPKPGDFKYLLRAGVGFGKLLLSATLVFQEKDSPVVSDTLHLLRSATLVAN